MAKVTGLGGIFFKVNNPEETKEWYSKHLGLKTDAWGAGFKWRGYDDTSEKGYTQWSPFPADTEYFEPSGRDFMINYRVEGIEELLSELRAAGVQILDDIATYEYGKFVHILDPEGNKIELWEPDNSSYEKFVEGKD